LSPTRRGEKGSGRKGDANYSASLKPEEMQRKKEEKRREDETGGRGKTER